MTTEEEDLVSRINELERDIETYIDSNPDWIYYFLNPSAGGNEEIFDYIKEHPDDWKDYIDFEVSNISCSCIYIKIHIDDYTDCGITLGRYIYLINFKEAVERNKMLYDSKLDEIKRENIKADIMYLKDALLKKEEELKRLENG